MKYLSFILLSAFFLFSCKEKKNAPIADKDIYYTCSMDPQVRENQPGKCPVCKMELTMARKSSHLNTDEIQLSAQQVQLGNIHTDTLGKTSIGEQIVLNATLNIDQERTNAISMRVKGRIDKLYFKNLGEYVTKGTRLFDIYSEDLNNAKQEYLIELEKQKTLDNTIIDFARLVQAAKKKLLLWGMTEAQITELENNKEANSLTPFYSNSSGYLAALEIKEGDYLNEGSSVMRLADLSILWAEAQVYASQLSTIDRNGVVLVQFPDLPGKTEKGRIDFVNPEINPDTRINLIRISVLNTSHQLKPGMSAYVTLNNPKHNSLTLPVDAVIRDNRGASVWILTGDNKFKFKMIEVGLESNDNIEIKSGLKPGDIVVISGAYLLNSEYIFKQGANPMDGMDMSNMKM